MTSTDHSPLKGHDEVWILLPWYINGSLEDAEKARVKRHLRQCLDCRREMVALRRFAEKIADSPTVTVSAYDAYARLWPQLQSRSQPLSAGPQDRLQAWFTRLLWRVSGEDACPQWRWIVALAVVLSVVAPLGFWLGQQQGIESDYRTLADPNRADQGVSGDLQVVFAKDISQQQIDSLVAAVGGQIVAGPSELGVYAVRLVSGHENSSTVPAAIAYLRTQPAVVLAEPMRRH